MGNAKPHSQILRQSFTKYLSSLRPYKSCYLRKSMTCTFCSAPPFAETAHGHIMTSHRRIHLKNLAAKRRTRTQNSSSSAAMTSGRKPPAARKISVRTIKLPPEDRISPWLLLPLQVRQLVVDRCLRIQFPDIPTDDAHILSFGKRSDALIQPTLDQVAVAIEKLDKRRIRSMLHDAGEAFIPPAGCTERSRRIEFNHMTVHRCRVLSAAIDRTGVDINHRPGPMHH